MVPFFTSVSKHCKDSVNIMNMNDVFHTHGKQMLGECPKTGFSLIKDLTIKDEFLYTKMTRPFPIIIIIKC